ncbi:Domain of unknown function DUF1863 [Chloroherpeton thalassium ATCC 35110]|uniref:Thoeris protein ThsB TIR-like domain-containing protein n=1 Tax=Chloroherpeton thalassium (strain ATCC 35110 / GB-78) TaxID=517418 RepID=B3QX68_CHLT3|nr:TIR domain-containing protein [Chloroherpeton thalassium]ACF14878.1 Domain of unknown function DUF1863 [Chloroherpeton thalassium ATCC 35110]
MNKKIFISFHYDRDAWRAAQVRNHPDMQYSFHKTELLDAAKWDKLKQKGDIAIKNWIKCQLEGSTVTIVLIGKETAQRRFIKYEIEQSYYRGNGLIGIYIHKLKNQFGYSDEKGENPFEHFYLHHDYLNPLTKHTKTYDWIDDNGPKNISSWIEDAAKSTLRKHACY